MDLSEFLLARIAEDREWSQVAVNQFGWHRWDDCVLAQSEGFGDCTCGYPARVLAECEAKRRIVGRLAAADRYAATEGVTTEYAEGHDHGILDAARFLALPYADHADYDEAWRP